MKKPLLVVYEYGQGAVWAYVLARSRDEIERQFPELEVVGKAPRWMSKAQLSDISQTMTFDIDRKDGLLAKILEQRSGGVLRQER